ncbi:hypothetical protein SAMN05518801_1379 [Novosphingobium sp. CF614]|uniref:hypothetical protein n=1 Tax=Novosphingobium sp. CF614 TaxID=1884364 RepID=UPI0008F2F1E7|nr:hypothetical protein [Novosphingobium sp. CF614]SFG50755.1 hypothetical protein SAMN05518801_1379 [Novosphingobium sp. CF614]
MTKSVSTNDEAAVDDMVNHLRELGHCKFGLVNGPATHAVVHRRRKGFLSALAKSGMDVTAVQEARPVRSPSSPAFRPALIS